MWAVGAALFAAAMPFLSLFYPRKQKNMALAVTLTLLKYW